MGSRNTFHKRVVHTKPSILRVFYNRVLGQEYPGEPLGSWYSSVDTVGESLNSLFGGQIGSHVGSCHQYCPLKAHGPEGFLYEKKKVLLSF